MGPDEKFLLEKRQYIDDLLHHAKHDKPVDRAAILAAALACALDARKLEVEMYWNRAAYFWVILAAIFAAYFTLAASTSQNLGPWYIVCTGLVGYIFSFSWYLVNKGSRYWQQNWDMHVDFLEDEAMGSLFKTVKNPRGSNPRRVIGGHTFSVTKINEILSAAITLVWACLIYASLQSGLGVDPFWAIGITAGTAIAIGLVIFLLAKSKLPREKGKLYVKRYPC